MDKILLLMLALRYVQKNGRFLHFDDRTKIIAHRGLIETHLENTLEALKEALQKDIDGIEFDVLMSKDGIPIIFHDDSLFRLSSRDELIINLSWAELEIIDLKMDRYKDSYRIPTLKNVLNSLSSDKIINVELKEAVLYAENHYFNDIISILNEYKNKNSIVVSSFSVDILKKVYKLTKELDLGLLVGPNISYGDTLKYNDVIPIIKYINPHISLLNTLTSKIIKTLGVPLILWGHKKLGEEMPFFYDKHFAIITDVPLELKQYL